MRKTKPRRKRKHTIGYYLMCGAPRTPIAHLEQLFAKGEPVWTAEFGAARSARKPGPDEQAEITARSDARASARAPRSSRRTGSACRPRVACRVKWPPTSLDAASAHRASPSARLAVPATDHGRRAAGRAAGIGGAKRVMPPPTGTSAGSMPAPARRAAERVPDIAGEGCALCHSSRAPAIRK
jgi:hypothetical protein